LISTCGDCIKANSSEVITVYAAYQVATIDDKSDFRTVNNAMKAVGFSNDDIESIWKMVAAVLHLVSIPACTE